MSTNVKTIIFLVIVVAIGAAAFGHIMSITWAMAGLVVGTVFIRWFNRYHKTHKVSTYAEVVGDGFFLVLISTVFVVLCSTFFKTLKKEIPRDPLVTAIAQDSGARMKEILSDPTLTTPEAKKARVDKQDEQGRTPLMWAAYVDFADRTKITESDEPRLALINLLAETGTDPDIRDKNGWTALSWAAWSGMPKVTEKLIEMGANINAADERGQTPLMIAALRGNSQVVQVLITHGADKSAAAQNGMTARGFAEEGQKAYPKRAADYSAALSVL